MTSSIILTDLARKCSAITKEKGFFDIWQGDEIGLLKHNVLQQYGELAEAYEAKRKGRFYSGEFEKDTFEDELADVCIFGLSCLGYLNEFEFGYVDSEYVSTHCQKFTSFTDFYLSLLNEDTILDLASKNDLIDRIYDITLSLFVWCENNNIDIFMHIEQKMKYNAGREKLHGKKF